jgi:hypothetical protein
MISLKLYALIIPKHIAENYFSGGINELKNYLPDHTIDEDDYLYAIRGKYVTHMATASEALIKKGVPFDENANKSDAFTVIAKEGIWWNVEWLIVEGDRCWFIADVEAPI